MIIVIGRGHSGTRLCSRLLSENGVYMGPTNGAGDLVPAEDMRLACCVYAANVQRGLPTPNFEKLMYRYTDPLFLKSGPRGFKIPAANMCYPWIAAMWPDAFFIHWVRDPWDAILEFAVWLQRTYNRPLVFGCPETPSEIGLSSMHSAEALRSTIEQEWA